MTGLDDEITRAPERARAAFLDDGGRYGCAEATYLALAGAFGLPTDTAATMALNGGVAYGGGTCGAITGAAVAVGLLAGRRVPDHREAKRIARELVAAAAASFEGEFGATSCRELTGFDLRAPGGHDAFVADGRWRTACTAQVEWMVRALAALGSAPSWEARLGELQGDATQA
jgi:C_GCAxxG_C_C family probable redox protein